jgi:hypothetical protein
MFHCVRVAHFIQHDSYGSAASKDSEALSE